MQALQNRRQFLTTTAAFGSFCAWGGLPRWNLGWNSKELFEISIAEWSWHRRLSGNQGKKFDNLGFPAEAAKFGFPAVEYVNSFFFDKAKDFGYLGELKRRATDANVSSLLIMCDRVGSLGHADAEARTKAIEGHYPWVEAAKFLGCHSIRVNAHSTDSDFHESQKLAADGLRRLAEFGAQHDIHVIVENHGGLSSNGAWLAGVMKLAGHAHCGTLPDFGNFRVSRNEMYDRYKGVRELMPFAKAVSAKSHDFDENGNEKNTDYRRMLKIVVEAGYRGFIGVEYEGGRLSEDEGILATKRLLEKVRTELTAEMKKKL